MEEQNGRNISSYVAEAFLREGNQGFYGDVIRVLAINSDQDLTPRNILRKLGYPSTIPGPYKRVKRVCEQLVEEGHIEDTSSGDTECYRWKVKKH